MGSGDIFPRISDLDQRYGRVSIRRLYAMPVAPLGRAGEPPDDAAPLLVVAGPRRPLAGPGHAVALEVAHG